MQKNLRSLFLGATEVEHHAISCPSLSPTGLRTLQAFANSSREMDQTVGSAAYSLISRQWQNGRRIRKATGGTLYMQSM